jgi:predicted nucleic acid-binding protein
MLLDTNVLSELMRPNPAPAVLSWFALQTQAQATHLISAVTQAEILLGIELLPDGQRKAALSQASQAMFDVDFKGHILPFDQDAARNYAQIVARRTAQGRPISTEDAQIAATAVQHQLPLVTRNTRDFELIPELQLVNPWTP